jgi:ssDNA-binding Zn-finger/Zn-ribbon topoisomerase 1
MGYTFKCLNKKCLIKFDYTLRIKNLKSYPCPKCWSQMGVKEMKPRNHFAEGLKYKGIGDS